MALITRSGLRPACISDAFVSFVVVFIVFSFYAHCINLLSAKIIKVFDIQTNNP